MDFDFFSPCDFTNIQGDLHSHSYVLGEAIDEFPPFQDNNAFTAKAHLRNASLCIRKYRPYSNYEDVKMKIFVLTLSGDALDWFTKFPNNTFDSL